MLEEARQWATLLGRQAVAAAAAIAFSSPSSSVLLALLPLLLFLVDGLTTGNDIE